MHLIGDIHPGKCSLIYSADYMGGDLESLRITLSAWVAALTVDADSLVMQLFTHPCHFLSIDSLMYLSSEYPGEYKDFMSQLVPVRSAEEVWSGVTEASLNSKYRNKLVGCDVHEVSGMWIRTLPPSSPAVAVDSCNMKTEKQDKAGVVTISGDVEEVGTSVTAMFVPLCNISNVTLLRTHVRVCRQLGDEALFDSPVVILALQFIWDNFGREKVLQGVIRWIIFVLVYSFAIYSYFTMIQSGNLVLCDVARFVQAVPLLMTVLGLFTIISAIVQQMKLTLKFSEITSLSNAYSNFILTIRFIATNVLTDIWHIQEFTTGTCIAFGLLNRVVHGRDTINSVAFLGIGSFGLFFRGLYFMRAFSGPGPLGLIYILLLYFVHGLFYFV